MIEIISFNANRYGLILPKDSIEGRKEYFFTYPNSFFEYVNYLPKNQGMIWIHRKLYMSMLNGQIVSFGDQPSSIEWRWVAEQSCFRKIYKHMARFPKSYGNNGATYDDGCLHSIYGPSYYTADRTIEQFFIKGIQYPKEKWQVIADSWIFQ